MTNHPNNFYIALLHDKMVDKDGKLITTSITTIDLHDICRSATTYGAKGVFIAHPSPTLRALSHQLKEHWECGFGSSYNPNRSQALKLVELVSDLDEAIMKIDLACSQLPKIIATSAKDGGDRISFNKLKELLSSQPKQPYLLLFGTGWGMSQELLERADYFLKPILGNGDYNHLSVRSACAIALDRLFGR
jgi:hypothetical protein